MDEMDERRMRYHTGVAIPNQGRNRVQLGPQPYSILNGLELYLYPFIQT